MSDTYITTYRCENCGDVKYYHPGKGMDIKLFLDVSVCSNCGCDIIQRKIKE